jgi:predicted RNase H-like HicB family nuclease
MPFRKLTSVLSRERRSWVALCPELDVASQGPTSKRAKANLIEAVELFLECANESEICRRLQSNGISRFEAKRV